MMGMGMCRLGVGYHCGYGGEGRMGCWKCYLHICLSYAGQHNLKYVLEYPHFNGINILYLI